MPAKYRYKRPKTTQRASTVPVVFMQRDAIQLMNDLQTVIPERVNMARELFLLELAWKLRSRLLKLAPDVPVGGMEYDYAQDLRIAIVDGVADEDAVAIYFDGRTAKLPPQRVGSTALFFRARSTSPDWVGSLMRWGPWPAAWVPMKVTGAQAAVVARAARPNEIKALEERLYRYRTEVERDFADNGAPRVHIGPSDYAAGMEVQEDIGFNVLRTEFGYDGRKQVAHWRPALKQLMGDVPEVLRKVQRYIESGHEGIFDLPPEHGEISERQLRKWGWFQRELAPFAPR